MVTGDTPFRGKHLHLIGIGGCGMSALVPLLQEAGARLSGCDLTEGRAVQRLRALGIPVALGHDPAHLRDADLVVYSSAIAPANPELRRASDGNIPVYSRPACLAELMRGMRTVAVAGSHGKTTTTWMLAHLLLASDLDPVVMVGGALEALGGGGGRAGRGNLFISEVDESDGGFRHVAPEIAIVTNLDHEHLRHYGSYAQLLAAFRDWLHAMGSCGAAIVPAEGLDPRVLAGFQGRIVRCGIDSGDVAACGCSLEAEGSRCRIRIEDEDLGPMRVAIPGRHMVLNATMAVAAAWLLSPRLELGAMATCERVRRRFALHGSPGGVRVVEDYGHHPTEIAATIAAARLAGGRVHVLFQPHRYSRTADCQDLFAVCFRDAWAVAILPTYAAGEDPLPGGGGRELAERVAAQHHLPELVQFAAQRPQAVGFIAAHAQPGDTCLVMGAGDVNACCPLLVEALA